VADTPRLSGRTVLAVFAHPDDESLACGGTLARLSDAGAQVILLCATRGEKGLVTDQSLVAREDLASVRTHELHDAAKILGISEVLLFEHPDGDLRWADVPELHVEIVAAIQRYRPDTVITFAEDGLYWHLDHIGIHERTYTAVKSFGPAAPALYYVVMRQGLMRKIVQTALDNGVKLERTPFNIDPDAFGDHAKPPTLAIDIHKWVSRKVEALRCHRTQIGPFNPFRHLTAEQEQELLGVELFRREALEGGRDSALELLGQPVVNV
jgi:LmbE family N-acetylglucosaminyl deacetylase